MDFSELTAKANEAMASSDDFSKKVKFDFGDTGKLLLDGVDNKATNEDGEADTTITVDWEDFKKIASGEMDGTAAFMQGKMKVTGDMSVAMQLQSLMAKFA